MCFVQLFFTHFIRIQCVKCVIHLVVCNVSVNLIDISCCFLICFTLSNEVTMFQALLSGFSNITMVFEALVRMKDVSLVYKALISQMGELPESCLVLALQCFLR